MSEKTYPYEAWTLMPSFKPALATLKNHLPWSGDGWEESSTGKPIHVDNLFPTKEAAIAAGWERVHAQETKLAKMLDSLNKKRTALAKAAEV